MEGRGESLSAAHVLERRGVGRAGLRDALRRARDPLLFGVLPALYASYAMVDAYDLVGVVGFDFRGTIWEPARAVLDGTAIYPEPTRAAIELGNPAVYPPFVVLLSTPIALLPVGAASIVWALVLAAAAVAALWLVGVRDWRCYAVAVASTPVIEGLFVGNLTVLLMLPLALAWRYRHNAWVAGLALGAAVAAKPFVWPLVVWLLVTRRFRAAAWATGSAVVLVLGAWAIVGFDGFRDYPALLDELQQVYAPRSLSLATTAAGFGASVSLAVAVAAAAGLASLGVAAWLARRADGDRRAFSLAVAASVVAAPVMWIHYAALLLVPIAIRWPRIAAAWFFGFVILLAAPLPGVEPRVPEPCCRPADVPKFIWDVNHGIAEPWQSLGVMGVIAAVVVALSATLRSELKR
jgi:hypothetical protein